MRSTLPERNVREEGLAAQVQLDRLGGAELGQAEAELELGIALALLLAPALTVHHADLVGHATQRRDFRHTHAPPHSRALINA
jgi:hypothetical protein